MVTFFSAISCWFPLFSPFCLFIYTPLLFLSPTHYTFLVHDQSRVLFPNSRGTRWSHVIGGNTQPKKNADSITFSHRYPFPNRMSMIRVDLRFRRRRYPITRAIPQPSLELCPRNCAYFKTLGFRRSAAFFRLRLYLSVFHVFLNETFTQLSAGVTDHLQQCS